MIALLSCSKGWCQSDAAISSTGVLEVPETSAIPCEDSVKVAISDLKIANAKMTELKYANSKISILENVINIDKQELDAYKNNTEVLNSQIKKLKIQRTIFGSTTVAAVLGVIVTLIFK